MKKKIQILLALFIILSCSKEDDKTKPTFSSRPSVPIDNSKVQIGNQIWMTKNLNTSRYQNGDPIPQVQDQIQWQNLTTGAWCYYENNTANGKIYGKLYNWYAVNDSRGLAPQGWHIPTIDEFNTLSNFLGGVNVAGGKMKATGITYWLSPNVEATNSSGFTGLPGGSRGTNSFLFINNYAYFWSSTSTTQNNAWIIGLDYNTDNLFISDFFFKPNGFSVRCIKN
jgi:uncharacterized protein (TIGR02145 family)